MDGRTLTRSTPGSVVDSGLVEFGVGLEMGRNFPWPTNGQAGSTAVTL
jgi:hypothetical protein